MKIYFLFVLYFASFWQYQHKSINEVKGDMTVKDDIKVEFTKPKIENSRIYFSYVLTNSSNNEYLVFNQGSSERPYVSTFVEPKENGLIEISHKLFSKPIDRKCPNREAPVYGLGQIIKPSKTIKSGELSFPISLTAFTPFDSCIPKLEMPPKIRAVRFCVGFAKIQNKNALRHYEKDVYSYLNTPQSADYKEVCSPELIVDSQ